MAERQETSILVLNDDCLYYIFSYLNLRHLVNDVERVCQRFEAVAQMIYRTYGVLDFNELVPRPADKFLAAETKLICSKVGPYVHTLKASNRFHFGARRIPKAISQYCTNLRSVYLEGFNFFIPDWMENFISVFKNVKVAELTEYYLNDEVITTLLQVDQLEELHLSPGSYCGLYGNDEAKTVRGTFLDQLKNMRAINLNHNIYIEPDHFKRFCVSNANLQSLNIKYCSSLDDTCMQVIAANLRNLQSLMISIPYKDAPSEGFCLLADLPKLTHLELSRRDAVSNRIMGTFLANICAHNRLQHLAIFDADEIGENKSLSIGKLTKLQVLELTDAYNCFDFALDNIASTETLQNLVICGSQDITTDSLGRLIERCHNLRYIDVFSCKQIKQSFFNSIPLLLSGRSDTSSVLEIRNRSTIRPKYQLRFSPPKRGIKRPHE